MLAMSDPKVDMLVQTANVGAAIVSGNYIGALDQGKKLLAMIEAYVVPPIDAPALDPGDRAAVDAEVDAEVPKP
jgi:hypothetical protein